MTVMSSPVPPILPPATLGMLGGGQLGRFFVSAAHEMGYKVWVPSDCTAAESEHRKTEALRQLHEVFKCAVRPAVRAAAR